MVKSTKTDGRDGLNLALQLRYFFLFRFVFLFYFFFLFPFIFYLNYCAPALYSLPLHRQEAPTSTRQETLGVPIEQTQWVAHVR